MPTQPVTQINLLTVDPSRQAELIALLRQSTETVIRTLPGWKATRLVAARDGASVVICSDCESAEAIEAMRSDPRMVAYFPKIAALARFDTILGTDVLPQTQAA